MWSVYSDGELIARWSHDMLGAAITASRLSGGYEQREAKMVRFFNYLSCEVAYATLS